MPPSSDNKNSDEDIFTRCKSIHRFIDDEVSDIYETPTEYVLMLQPYLEALRETAGNLFHEPCDGHSAISSVLESFGWNVIKTDKFTKPISTDILTDFKPESGVICTNTPYKSNYLYFLSFIILIFLISF